MYLVNSDVDKYLVQFLDLPSIKKVMVLSKIINKNLNKLRIIKQINEYINDKKYYLHDIIIWASKKGYVEILEWSKIKNEICFCKHAIASASENGHVEILEWFKNSRYDFLYDEHAVNYASQNGHVAVLEWFKNS